MRQPLSEHPEIATWIVECFSGKFLGERVYWDEQPPANDILGEYTPGSKGYVTILRVSDRRELTGYDRLSSLIFELMNSKRANMARNLFARAMASDMTAEEYATSCLRLEHEALIECKKLLEKHNIPSKGNLIVQKLLSITDCFDDFAKSERGSATMEFFSKSHWEWVESEQGKYRPR